MKRVFAIVLSLCMVLALTACNRAGPEEEGASSPSNAPANSPAASKTDFPSQSFQASVIWGAGGSTDIICRGIAPYVEPLLGQSIIYTNRAGAAGGIAMEYVNSQPADGYELLMTADNPQVAKVLGASNLDLDDFIPINIFCESYGALVVRKDSPYDTYDKLIEGMKAGKVTFGDNGVGGLPANLVAMMKSVEGDIQPVNVSFDGEGSIVTALMGNQIDCSICTINSVTEYIKSGDIVCIALFANEAIDMEACKGLPLISDCNPGYNDYLPWANFFGVCVKAGTPDDVVAFLTDCFKQAATNPEFEAFERDMGCNPISLTGQEAVDYIDHYKAVTSYLIYDSGASDVDPATFGVERVTAK